MKRNFRKIFATSIITILIFSFSIIQVASIYAQFPWLPPDYNQAQKETFIRACRRLGTWNDRVYGINTKGFIFEIKTTLINTGLTATDPVESAYQFFELQKDLFQIMDPRKGLVVNRIERINGGSGIIHFDQLIANVRVYMGGCYIQYDSSSAGVQLSRFYCDNQINGLLPDAHNIDPIPAVDSLEAACIAQADYAHGGGQNYISYLGLWIGNDYFFGIRPFPEKRIHLFWHLIILSDEYFIDAHNGEILFDQNLDRY
jgi:hypothetical protein